MKKLMLIMMAFLSVAVTAEATISETSIAAGGVYPGQPFSEVISIYGNPVKAGDLMGGHPGGRIYSFSKNETTFDIWANSKVLWITVKGNNGISTPDGIHVGSTVAEVIKAYGEPDFRQSSKDLPKKTRKEDYETYFYYQHSSTPHFGPKYLCFTIVEGKVDEYLARFTNW